MILFGKKAARGEEAGVKKQEARSTNQDKLNICLRHIYFMMPSHCEF